MRGNLLGKGQSKHRLQKKKNKHDAKRQSAKKNKYGKGVMLKMPLFPAIYFQEEELTLPIFIQEPARFIVVVIIDVFLFKPVRLNTIMKICKQRVIMILYSISRKFEYFTCNIRIFLIILRVAVLDSEYNAS